MIVIISNEINDVGYMHTEISFLRGYIIIQCHVYTISVNRECSIYSIFAPTASQEDAAQRGDVAREGLAVLQVLSCSVVVQVPARHGETTHRHVPNPERAKRALDGEHDVRHGHGAAGVVPEGDKFHPSRRLSSHPCVGSIGNDVHEAGHHIHASISHCSVFAPPPAVSGE